MKHSFKVGNNLGCLLSPLIFSIVLDALAQGFKKLITLAV